MGKDSGIQWTRHTFNAWWGCQRISPGCEHCYAETFAKRTGNLVWGPQAPRRFFGDKHWDEPLRWNAAAAKAGERHRVFCSSMSDVFEDRDDLHVPRGRLFDLVRRTPSLDWLLLTKRPENAEALWAAAHRNATAIVGTPEFVPDWAPNVWLGTTVEDQRRASARIPALTSIPGPRVRFLSCEPLLEAIGFGDWMAGAGDSIGGAIDWVIVGGESGAGARPFDVEWARSIVRQCRDAGVAPFVKQMGEKWAREHGRRDPATGRVVDLHGGDMVEWPEDLRVREFPEARA